jgi:hypothetical protein
MARESKQHPGSDESNSRSQLLPVVRLFWTEDAQVHRYWADRLAGPGWERLMLICEESLTSPRRHDRGHLTRRSTDNARPSECHVCAHWTPADEDVHFVLVDYAPPSHLANYRASRRDSASLEPGTQPHRRCRFCLAVYDDVTHTEQCEQGHDDTGDNSTA